MPSETTRCDLMRCGAMRCDAMRCDGAPCSAVLELDLRKLPAFSANLPAANWSSDDYAQPPLRALGQVKGAGQWCVLRAQRLGLELGF